MERVAHGKDGRPAYEPPEGLREWVKHAAAAGWTQDRICSLIINPTTGQPISKDTLVKYYGRELAWGLDEANLEMSMSAFKQGIGFEGVPNPNFGNIDTRKYIEQDGKRFKNPSYLKVDRQKWIKPPIAPTPLMTIWWEKTRAGKKEGTTVEHTGPGGAPLYAPTTIVVLPANGRERYGTPILDLIERTTENESDPASGPGAGARAKQFGLPPVPEPAR